MKLTRRQHKRNVLQKWVSKADSAILNHQCKETMAALDSLTLKQLNAVLKVVCGAYSSGYRDGSEGTRELLLKKYRTHHTLRIDSHSGNVSVYDDNGDFVDKVHNMDEADALVNKRNEARKGA